MKKEGEIITRGKHYGIYDWLKYNVWYYQRDKKHYTLTSDCKINAYCDVLLYDDVTQIKYPFGCVNGFFNCGYNGILTSLINSPEKIVWSFDCCRCANLISFKGFPKYIEKDFLFSDNQGNRFSNNPSKKEKYKLYLAMWLELFESITNEERKEYITNYKNKADGNSNYLIIPIEILKEYGF
jgi:hypothetical protein